MPTGSFGITHEAVRVRRRTLWLESGRDVMGECGLLSEVEGAMLVDQMRLDSTAKKTCFCGKVGDMDDLSS